MFEKITPANWVMFAMKHYDNPQAEGEDEFQEDLNRFKYLKRLLKNYCNGGVLRERLILNHIIVLNNVLGIEASGTLLLYRIEPPCWEALKTFMLYLNMIPETNDLENISIDPFIWKILQDI
jgi:hypothetical protein|tara:strand:- start:1347 stop:1712 length:366 start_codon:yes stop_codon:yes gene_type:complete